MERIAQRSGYSRFTIHIFKDLPVPWHLHTGSKLEIRTTNLETLGLRFCLGSFALLCCPSLAYANEGLTEK